MLTAAPKQDFEVAAVPKQSDSKVPLAVWAIVLFGAALLLQYLGNAYKAELNVESDDPAHYVTGVMVHDYIAHGFPAAPRQFAQNFYAHYPKVAIGHWPPVFYIVQAIWMLVFGDSIHSDLVLMAVLSAIYATTLFRVIQREFHSMVAAAGVSLLLLLMPVVELNSGTVMADLLVAVFCQFGVLKWARYLERRRWQDVAAFAGFLCLAILTKGNAYALLLIAPISIVMGRRFELLKAWHLWCFCGLAMAVCVPWSLVTRDLITSTMQMKLTPEFFVRAIDYYSLHLVTDASVPVSIFALLGLVLSMIELWRNKRSSTLWLSVVGWILGFLIFHALVPAGLETRYLLLVMPAWLLLMARGIRELAFAVPISTLRLRTYSLAIVVGALFFGTSFYIPRRQALGFEDLARTIEEPRFAKNVILVSSQGDGEGLLVSELVQFEKDRPNHVVLRAGRVLADSDWNQRNYRLRYRTPEEIMSYLRSIPAGLVVIDKTAHYNPTEHQRLLEEMVQEYPQIWRRVATFPAGKPVSESVALYRLAGQDPVLHKAFTVDVNGTLPMKMVVQP